MEINPGVPLKETTRNGSYDSHGSFPHSLLSTINLSEDHMGWALCPENVAGDRRVQLHKQCEDCCGEINPTYYKFA